MDQRQRYAALPWWERLWLKIPVSPAAAIGGGAVIVAAVVLVVMNATRPGSMPNGIECRQRFEHAKTAADTQLIDAMRPTSANAKDASAFTCGELRMRGSLK